MTGRRGLAGFAHRRYERRGSVVVVELVVLGGILASLLAAVMTLWTARYLRMDGGEIAWSFAIGYTVLWLGMAAGVATKRDLIRCALTWRGAGRTAARAPAVWDALARLPLEVTVRGGLVVAVTGVPFMGAAGVLITDEPWWVGLPIGLAVSTSGLAAAAVLVATGELLLRPMMADVARLLPAGFTPSALTWRLRAKMLAPLPLVTLFAVLTTAAFVDLVDAGAERLSFALGLTLAVAGLTGVGFWIVTRSALDPLDELLEATERVRAGDLETQVPVVTSDDLGQLSVSFNRMVADLRERNRQLAASRARIVAAGVAERRRVERDLHDGAQQALVLTQLKLARLADSLEGEPAALAGEARDDLGRAIAELRELARGIYPSVLETDGLPGALRDAADRAALPVSVRTNGTGWLPRTMETAVYFCCLEALQNAAKHAGPGTTVIIELSHADGVMRFCVDDDGAGFDPRAVTNGTGLEGLADRLGVVGGTLEITSAPGRGTRIEGRIPEFGA